MQAGKGKQPAIKAESEPAQSKGGEDDGKSSEEIQRLNMLVKQRDNEIGILLNYLNKKKEAGEDAGSLPVTRMPENSFASNSTAAHNDTRD